MPPNQSTRLKYSPSEKFKWDKQEIAHVFTAAAASFVREEGGSYQILAASRDWFLEEWGRDTFIALPGILLATGRFEEAKSVIESFAKHEKNGLIPNRIKSPDDILYNTVDASMWFIQSVKAYLEHTKDRKFVEKMLPLIKKIIQSYERGTGYERFGKEQVIKMDPSDGLIVSPAQATWMDTDPAGDGTTMTTPRNGKAVEINALWYANLKFLTTLGVNQHRVLIQKVKKSFRKKFWNKSERTLFDVIEGDLHGGAIRPNMIIAVSHGEDLLTKTQQIAVTRSVTADLLTPGGLRTLSPRDSNYCGEYDTYLPIAEKDKTYHQGTAWPWLIGPYCDALVRVLKYEKKSQRIIQNELKKILTPLVRFCLESPHKSLPELFSGDPPHDPGGTTSQAWSVGEVFRVLKEHHLV